MALGTGELKVHLVERCGLRQRGGILLSEVLAKVRRTSSVDIENKYIETISSIVSPLHLFQHYPTYSVILPSVSPIWVE